MLRMPGWLAPYPNLCIFMAGEKSFCRTRIIVIRRWDGDGGGGLCIVWNMIALGGNMSP